MSIRTVRSEIKNAMKTNGTWEEKSVTRQEALKIVAEAAKGPVTSGELAQLKKLVKDGFDPTTVFTAAIPELRGDQFYMDPGAKQVLEGFISRHTPTDPHMFTLAIPENPGDAVHTPTTPPNMFTLAIPENPSDGSL
jgi:hypothetical protein